ncbi:putative site-specific DNA recombinase [Magnetospirillum gryphiswaldense MSR-1 v2]|uniref:Site-specific DNA recombinase n=2 Tax=Magnetospirillum gryphiswaldense TaxID=55518 RepID=V6F2M3_MAGGM|nr:recombinase family protein [Magnetospirillum gryphiswaldense]CAM78240.1 Site-specific recombinase and resolvase superfamily protein [Magnetospirillum gryphiswaldense MSR-1]CDK99642.1 putative site-specific DNA recombinase [Magnetospirillum gryphiswaldense MSR-1 v2]
MTMIRPLRIAIYARYSSDLQNPSSIEDQVALCRQLVDDQFHGRADPRAVLVFSDSAISGSTLQRPGLIRLMNAIKAGRVDVVVAEGLDRLSRNLKDIAGIYETLDYHHVMIWTAHEGRISELHIGLKGTMNALVLRDLKARIKRGHRSRIAAGYAASSCAYGYRVVRGVVDEKGANINGLREIDEAAAPVISRIYDEYIAGRKIPEIIAGLNKDGIPAPNGGLWKRNAIMGGAKKQEGILRNEIYTGKLIFNRSHVVRDPVSNKKKFIHNPESDWTKVDVPHLRIISDAQWAAVRVIDQPKPQQPRQRKTPVGLTVYNQHALTGWVKCGWCGGSKSLANETRYLCSTHRYAKSCANSRGTKEPVLMARTFGTLYHRIETGPDFTPGLTEFFAHQSRRRTELENQEQDIQARIVRLLDAVEHGVDHENARDRILRLQDELGQIRAELTHDLPAPLPVEAAIRARLMNAVQSVELSNDVPTQRLMFQCLLSEIVLTPIPDKHQGETVVIKLREEGWAEFWSSISSE